MTEENTSNHLTYYKKSEGGSETIYLSQTVEVGNALETRWFETP